MTIPDCLVINWLSPDHPYSCSDQSSIHQCQRRPKNNPYTDSVLLHFHKRALLKVKLFIIFILEFHIVTIKCGIVST